MGRPTAADDSPHTPCLCPCHRNEHPTAYHRARRMSRCRGGRRLLPFGRTCRGHRQCRVFPLAGLLHEISGTGEGSRSEGEVFETSNPELRTSCRVVALLPPVSPVSVDSGIGDDVCICFPTPSTW